MLLCSLNIVNYTDYFINRVQNYSVIVLWLIQYFTNLTCILDIHLYPGLGNIVNMLHCWLI